MTGPVRLIVVLVPLVFAINFGATDVMVDSVAAVNLSSYEAKKEKKKKAAAHSTRFQQQNTWQAYLLHIF